MGGTGGKLVSPWLNHLWCGDGVPFLMRQWYVNVKKNSLGYFGKYKTP